MTSTSACSTDHALSWAALRSLSPSKIAALRGAMVLLILSTTALERFGINFGGYSLNAAFLGLYGLLAVAAISDVLMLSFTRVFLYGACLGLALVSALANDQRTSFASLLLLAAVYLPYVFVVKPNTAIGEGPTWVLRAFLNIALFCALAGIFQFAAQFFVHADWLFDFSESVPSLFRGSSNFNTVISVGAQHKSNGFFFREPSGFSLIMALALIGEGVSYKRVPRLACFGLALLLTYSGTGLLALFIGMLFPLGRGTIVRVLLLGCIGGLVLWLLGDALNLSFTLGRVHEFDSEQSSAYIRYIAPLRLIGDTIDTEAWTPWIGHGPGTISRETRGYEFHDPTWAKLLFEYGILGLILFLALFLVALHRREVPIQIRATIFVAWLLMGGHLLSPELNFLALALVGLVPHVPALESDRRRESTGPASMRGAAPQP